MTGRCLWRAPCVIAVDWRVPCGSAFVQRLPCIIPVVWRVRNGESGASGGALGENFVALPLGGWKFLRWSQGLCPAWNQAVLARSLAYVPARSGELFPARNGELLPTWSGGLFSAWGWAPARIRKPLLEQIGARFPGFSGAELGNVPGTEL